MASLDSRPATTAGPMPMPPSSPIAHAARARTSGGPGASRGGSRGGTAYHAMNMPETPFPPLRAAPEPSMEALFPVLRRNPLSPRRSPRGARGGRESPTRPDALTTSTQVVERAPQVDRPLRVAPPSDMNAPPRKPVTTKDEEASSAFSATAHSAAAARASREPGAARFALPPAEKARGRDADLSRRLRDAEMLATACRRAARPRLEGVAHFCQGVLHDNGGRAPLAIGCFVKYAAIAAATGDAVGEALAHNATGVDYHELARAAAPGARREKLLRAAAHYYEKHLAIADVQGSFVAYCNMGMAYADLGELSSASRCLQSALKIAIQLDSAFGQSIAVGNMGLVAARQGDRTTAKACFEQYLVLVRGLRDKAAESDGLAHLGRICADGGDYEGASRAFNAARKAAIEGGARGLVKVAEVGLGMAIGNMRMQGHMAVLGDRARSVGSPKARSPATIPESDMW